MQMNYIKEAEDILKNYRKLKDSIENLENRKNHILYKSRPREPGAIDYSQPSIQKQNYSDDTINQICEITQINNQIKETEADMQVVEDILKQIKKEDNILEKFLVLKYIEKPKENLGRISKELGYSEDSNHTIYTIKNKALREFAIRYFGSKAIKYT